MSEPNPNKPTAAEWNYPMTTDPTAEGNSPTAAGSDPQAQATQRPGGGGAPGTGNGEPDLSDEAKDEWAGAKGPTESGKP
jgi:hypothetical protein